MHFGIHANTAAPRRPATTFRLPAIALPTTQRSTRSLAPTKLGVVARGLSSESHSVKLCGRRISRHSERLERARAGCDHRRPASRRPPSGQHRTITGLTLSAPVERSSSVIGPGPRAPANIAAPDQWNGRLQTPIFGYGRSRRRGKSVPKRRLILQATRYALLRAENGSPPWIASPLAPGDSCAERFAGAQRHLVASFCFMMRAS